jgi:heterotetrameric sarcosine oxidase gamma subunit
MTLQEKNCVAEALVDRGSSMPLARAQSEITFDRRPGLSVQVEAMLGVGKVQIWGSEPGPAFRRIFGFNTPSPGSQIHEGGLNVAWLSPNEWLLTGREADVHAWLARIEERGEDEVLAVDLTHARTSFVLDGARTREVLASLCPVDLWSDSFPVGSVARTLLGDTNAFIARLSELVGGPRFRVIVDQTMEAYAARLFTGPQPR